MPTAPDAFPRRCRRLRLVAGLASLLLLAGFLSASHAQFLLVLPGGLHAGIHDGCFQIGRTDPQYLSRVHPVLGKALGVATEESWQNGFATAWRPFRAGGASGNRLMIPLWAPLLASVALAAAAHGALVGHRRGARGSCAHCGYDLTVLRKNATGPVTCPECGRPAPAASAS